MLHRYKIEGTDEPFMDHQDRAGEGSYCPECKRCHRCCECPDYIAADTTPTEGETA